jgi:carbon storage regulator CsrA
MLTLKRKAGETIVLTTEHGERITVLVERAGATVSLSITAPQTVVIHRGEIQEQIDRDRKNGY